MPIRKTREEQMVQALRESDDPVLDAHGIAEAVGVTAKTIRNHFHKLEDRDDVEEMEIGKTRVFFYSGASDETDPISGPEMARAYEEYDDYEPPQRDSGRKKALEKVAEVTGEWSIDLLGSIGLAAVLSAVSWFLQFAPTVSTASAELIYSFWLSVTLFLSLLAVVVLLLAFVSILWLRSGVAFYQGASERTGDIIDRFFRRSMT